MLHRIQVPSIEMLKLNTSELTEIQCKAHLDPNPDTEGSMTYINTSMSNIVTEMKLRDTKHLQLNLSETDGSIANGDTTNTCCWPLLPPGGTQWPNRATKRDAIINTTNTDTWCEEPGMLSQLMAVTSCFSDPVQEAPVVNVQRFRFPANPGINKYKQITLIQPSLNAAFASVMGTTMMGDNVNFFRESPTEYKTLLGRVSIVLNMRHSSLVYEITAGVKPVPMDRAPLLSLCECAELYNMVKVQTLTLCTDLYVDMTASPYKFMEIVKQALGPTRGYTSKGVAMDDGAIPTSLQRLHVYDVSYIFKVVMYTMQIMKSSPTILKAASMVDLVVYTTKAYDSKNDTNEDAYKHMHNTATNHINSENAIDAKKSGAYNCEIPGVDMSVFMLWFHNVTILAHPGYEIRESGWQGIDTTT